MVTMTDIKNKVNTVLKAYMKYGEIEIPEDLEITLCIKTADLKGNLNKLEIVGCSDYLYDGDGANQIFLYIR